MPTLDWLNRQAAFTTASRVPYRLLEPISAHGDAATGNLLIQGDNLEALKALLPFYRGQVKCIFIDPPYNTKSAFEHYDDNLEHAQWLSMMLPRLQLLRELLTDDGSIWVTIDDHEGHYLKVLMDEVFGRGNFVANALWQKVYSVRMDATAFSADHDHVFVYQKSAAFQVRRLQVQQEAKQFNHIDATTGERYRRRSLRKEGSNSRRVDRPNLWYSISGPDGVDIWPVKPAGTEGYWRWSPTTLAASRDQLEFVQSAAGWDVYVKQFLDNEATRPPSTVWPNDEVGHTHESKEEAKALCPEDVFTTPKPERLLARILELATNPSDLILDSFLGSGTTAAVAHKMRRRWIGIEMGEHAATHCLPRLQKVIDGEQGGISQAVGWQGGGGFRFMRLGAPVFDAEGRIHADVRFATLAAFVWQQETGTAYDPALARAGTPLLGVQPDGTKAHYLLFNGILGDKRPASGNVLTRAVLAALLVLHAEAAPAGAALIVYGEAVRVGPQRLTAAGVTFRQIPYELAAR